MAKESGWLKALKIYLGAHLAIVGVVVVGGIVLFLVAKKKGDQLSFNSNYDSTGMPRIPESEGWKVPQGGLLNQNWDWGQDNRSAEEIMDKMFQNDSEGMGSYHGGIS